MSTSTKSKSSKPWLLELRSSESFILIVICVAVLTDLFIYSMIVPILPDTLISRSGVPTQNVQRWITILLAAYGGALLIGSPIFGYIADQYDSRKIPFTAGLAALGLSTIVFMVSTSPYLLVIARFLQGISGSAVFVVGFAMVADNVERERISQSMGYVSSSMTIGSLLGPTSGGIIYEKLGYHGVFILPIVLVILDIILRFAMIEKSVARQWLRDLPGNYTDASTNHDTAPDGSDHMKPSLQPKSTGERSPLLSSSSSPPDRSTAREDGTGSGNAGMFYLLRTSRLPLILIAIIISFINFPAFETTLPIFVIRTFHWKSSGAGLIFLALSIPSLSGGLIGKVVDRVGTRYPCCIAFAIASVALICLRFVVHNSIAEKVILVCLLVVISLCATMVQVSSMAEVFMVAKETEKDQPGIFGGKSPLARVYALLSMAAAASHFCGPLLAGLVDEHAGWKMMTLALGLLCGVMAIPVGLFGGGSSHGRKTDLHEEV